MHESIYANLIDLIPVFFLDFEMLYLVLAESKNR